MICWQNMIANKDNFGADAIDDFCWMLAALHVDRIEENIKLASIEMDIVNFAREQKAKENKLINKTASVEMVQTDISDKATEQKEKEANTPKKPIKDSQETHEWCDIPTLLGVLSRVNVAKRWVNQRING